MCLFSTVGFGKSLHNSQASDLYSVQTYSLLANNLTEILDLDLNLLLRESFFTTL